MNIRDLKTALGYMFKAQVTPFIWGHAGVGKTSAVKQYAQEMGYKFFGFYLGTQADMGDILGLAAYVMDTNNNPIATRFAIPEWLLETIKYCEENPDSGAVIFLDEFNLARRDILNGMFSFALDKKMHTIQLPVNCHLVAAGNPPTDEYSVNDISSTALMSRFVHIKLEPTFQEWLAYARKTGHEETLLAFLQEQPELLADRKSEFKLPVTVDNRSYERASKLFAVGTPPEILDQLLIGIIGTERLVTYKAHLAKLEKPLTAEEVLSGVKFDLVKKWSNPEDVKSSLLSATESSLYIWVEAQKESNIKEWPKTMFDNLMSYLEILPVESAFACLRRLMSSKSLFFLEFLQQERLHTRLEVITNVAKGIKNGEVA